MDAHHRTESWARGASYEPYMGRWSRLIAREFVTWLSGPATGSWVEVGCGTGALTTALAEMAVPAVVLATDRSIPYVHFAREHVRVGPVQLVASEGSRLPVRSGTADAVVSGLVLNFLPVPAVGVAEMVRVARIGGTVAAYVWDYPDQMQLLRLFWDTAVELNPGAASLHEGRRFPLCQPSKLQQLWRQAALVEVKTAGIEVATRFRDFDDYWQPFLGGQGPGPTYVASLDAQRQEALRERLRARLPTLPDGQIELKARAWAVRGRRAA